MLSPHEIDHLKRVGSRRVNRLTGETLYMERANGRDQWWTYTDEGRHYVSENWAVTEIARGRANFVQVR